MNHLRKQIEWVGDSLERVRSFPEEARGIAGHQLHRVQSGEDPTDWKPFTSVGKGVREIRIHSPDEFRILYVTTIGNKVFVLHAFQKKTQTTAQKDILLAKKRYEEAKKRTQN